jgi:PTH1 family peptidyl-tRNA hydrolase
MHDRAEGANGVRKVVLGLGNPGERYLRNRHNAGFLAVDALAQEAGSTWTTHYLSRVCVLEISGLPVLLAKPLTYMNRSGEAVHALLDDLDRGAEDLLLLYDDLDLPLGRIRIRQKGSAGGHRGIESVMAAVETEQIMRIRMGIGEEGMTGDTRDFVLSDFPPERKKELDEMIQKAGDAVKSILTDGVSKSMTIFNA